MIVIVLIILIITIILFVYVKNNIEKFDNHHYVAEGDEGIIGDSVNAGKDVVWSPVHTSNIKATVPAIPGSTFEEGKNAVFKRFRECDIEKQYIIEEGEVGNASVVGKDRQCGDLLQCEYDTQYINTDIITNSVGYRTNNNSCADIISCTEYEDVIRSSMPQKCLIEDFVNVKEKIVAKLELFK